MSINVSSCKKMTHPYFRTSITFSISTILCIASFLAVYADSGNDSNSAINSTQLQNATNFSDIKCSKGLGHVLLEGQFHNGDTAYKVIFLRMSIYDQTGNLLTTGSGYISDIKPHEIKNFNAITRFNGDFSLCDVQIDNAIPK